PLWHERDISHSSVERVTIPDSCVLLDYILQKFTFVMDGLSVYPERMRQNLALSGGLVFSQKVLTELINKGMDRETAYELVQKHALKSYDEGIDFQSLISADKVINKYFGRKEIQACFNFSSLLQNVDYIFKRLSIEA
ncbi:MAG TPA: adenylosuccinate lyase, partial [Candidatus Omnitrophica bacterium]|nr:adenylosuccinate lyase [Candidatus Omnitrophota bacterium]